MSDIDFDELDKAVNSLMGSSQDKSADDSQPRPKTLSINSTVGGDEDPNYNSLAELAKKIGGETVEEKDEDEPIVENLDNIDEKKSLITPEALERSIDSGDERPVIEDEDDERNKVEVPERPVSPAVKRPRSGRFLDMVHPSADMRATPAALPARPVSQLPKPNATPPAPSEPIPPIGSPFLPDAKVEKRPLGGPKVEDEPEEEEQEPQEKLPIDSRGSTKDESAVETSSINNEEKEADDGSGDEQRPLDATNFDMEAAAQTQKLQSIEDEMLGDGAKESIQAVESGDTERILHDSTSYEEREKKRADAAKEGASIYDVNEYHKPLDHPPKQKSGWGVIVIIAIVLVVSIAGAAGAYFFFIAKP